MDPQLSANNLTSRSHKKGVVDYSGFVHFIRTTLNYKDFVTLNVTQIVQKYNCHNLFMFYLTTKGYMDRQKALNTKHQYAYRLNPSFNMLNLERLTVLHTDFTKSDVARSKVKIEGHATRPRTTRDLHGFLAYLLKYLSVDRFTDMNQSDVTSRFSLRSEFVTYLVEKNVLFTQKNSENRKVQQFKLGLPFLGRVSVEYMEKAYANFQKIRNTGEPVPDQLVFSTEPLSKPEPVMETKPTPTEVDLPKLPVNEQLFEGSWNNRQGKYTIRIIVTGPEGADLDGVVQKGLSLLDLI